MSNQNQISGVIYKKTPIQVISDKFKKVEFVIKTEETYPQYIPLQLKNDKCNLLDSANVGDSVTAHYNMEGRLWTGADNVEKCFMSLSAWKIEVTHAAGAKAGVDSGKPAPQKEEIVEDDLPF